MFFEKDHASTQTSFDDDKRKRFRSKGSCTQDDDHFRKSASVQTDPTTENLREILTLASRCPSERKSTEITTTVSRVIPEPERQHDESMDEFSTNFGDVVDPESSFVEKNDLKKNMKTKVQFDLETCEFSELLVPATPARIDVSSPIKPYSQSSQESELKSTAKPAETQTTSMEFSLNNQESIEAKQHPQKEEVIQKSPEITKESQEKLSTSSKSHDAMSVEQPECMNVSDTTVSNASENEKLSVQISNEEILDTGEVSLTSPKAENELTKPEEESLPKSNSQEKVGSSTENQSLKKSDASETEQSLASTKNQSKEEIITVTDENTSTITLSREENETAVQKLITEPEPKPLKSKTKTRTANKDYAEAKAPDDR